MIRKRHLFASVVVTVGILVSYVTTAQANSGAVAAYQAWPQALKTYTKEVCAEYDVDQTLALGVIYNESRFQSGLTHLNSNGTMDYGLMQVNEVNFDYLHETLGINSMQELLDDKVGIRCGVQLLAYHKQYTDNDSSALLRYQVGAGRYNQYLKSGEWSNETHQRVLTYQKEFQDYLSSLESIEDHITKQKLLKQFHRWRNVTFICWSSAIGSAIDL